MSSEDDRERHLELLLGRRVHDDTGRAIGRIEELHATQEGNYFVVSEIDLGPVALLERLSVRHFGFAWGGRPFGYRARWDQIDFEDERRITLTCPVDQLETIGPRSARHRSR